MKYFSALLALSLLAGPALAGHANPWATEEDTVQSKNHEANQAQSEDTPGEDEMKGVMSRDAHGKLGTTSAARRSD